MNYLEDYLQKIIERGNPLLAESVQTTVNDVSPRYLEKFSFCSHEIGLLFGNVQSGKTAQMFGIITRSTDLGFPIFIILTTDNVVLQQQTIDRVKEDLTGYCVCDEYDSELFAENNLEKPAIIVLKKNARTLKQWSNILGATGFILGNPLFIIDDEADATSLNTLVNKDRQSSINRYIDNIRKMSACSIYLQVTGTPQAILLQTLNSGWHPYFTYYFKPGKGYLGGDFFFPSVKPECISFIDSMDDPLLDSMVHHLLVSAQIILSGGKVCNFLIHPSVRKSTHAEFERQILKKIEFIRDNLLSQDLQGKFLNIYNEMRPQKSKKIEYDKLWNYINTLINSNINVLVMNGDSKISSEDYSKGSNIVIGGNTLGRGVTFPGLHTIYYTRTAKKPQADTMWQHSRMFGYDRDPGLMQVYIDEHLYKLFSDINATNNAIIAQIEKGIKNIKIYYPEGLNPTRKNVIDSRKVSLICGGTNYYPYDPDNDTIEQIDNLLSKFDENQPVYQVSLRLIKELLIHIVPSSDFKLPTFLRVLDMMIAEKPSNQGILIVRRNRNVAQGTGALISANDWKLGNSYTEKVVLTMYKVTGEKGWKGKKMWVPNIKLPDKIVYYDVME